MQKELASPPLPLTLPSRGKTSNHNCLLRGRWMHVLSLWRKYLLKYLDSSLPSATSSLAPVPLSAMLSLPYLQLLLGNVLVPPLPPFSVEEGDHLPSASPPSSLQNLPSLSIFQSLPPTIPWPQLRHLAHPQPPGQHDGRERQLRSAACSSDCLFHAETGEGEPYDAAEGVHSFPDGRDGGADVPTCVAWAHRDASLHTPALGAVGRR
mmetsp:Transcript_12426/g.27323  ORF Transcript_12426/g.27323 Transcript_12426/m.27323 type:complete len:208 (+) Transcript_12426:3199-3822(+)